MWTQFSSQLCFQVWCTKEVLPVSVFFLLIRIGSYFEECDARMGVNAKTEVLELISMLKFHIRFLWHIDLKDSEDLASSSKYHLQVLRLSLQQSARRLRCVNSKCPPYLNIQGDCQGLYQAFRGLSKFHFPNTSTAWFSVFKLKVCLHIKQCCDIFCLKACFDAAYGNICQLCVHLQMLVSSLSEIAWALLGWDAEKLIVILSHQMKSQCLAILDAYF